MRTVTGALFGPKPRGVPDTIFDKIIGKIAAFFGMLILFALGCGLFAVFFLAVLYFIRFLLALAG